LLGGTVVEEWFIQQASNLGVYTEIIFLNRRLEEPDFELTKPSTGQDYMSTNKHKTKTGDTS
jgi:hypothetical protein